MLSLSHPIQALLSRLKFRHLRVIQALGELETAAKVAEHLHVSPAAISKTLAEIEEIVGMPLFERGRRGMRATDIGKEMLEGSALLVGQLGRMAESLHSIREGTRGSFSMAFRSTLAHALIARAMCAYREALPDVDISVLEGGQTELIEQLDEGVLDLLFAYDDPRLLRKSLQNTPIVAAQKLVVVASATHPLLKRKRITAQVLSEQDWCIPSQGTRMLHHLQTAFRALDTPPPERGVRVSDVSVTTQLLRASNFLAVYPEGIAVQLELAGAAKVLPFKLGCRLEAVVMVWNSALTSRAPAKAFRELVLKLAC